MIDRYLNNIQKEIIQNLSFIAKNILEPNDKETPYSENKNMIDFLFIKTNDWKEKENIRLTIIDSKYSTNMNMRMYGINDISKKLVCFNDHDLLENAEIFLKNINSLDKNINNPILALFLGSYGIHKGDVNSKESALSIISKYLFFLTKHKFPIFDSLVQQSLWQLFEYPKKSDFYTFFENICYINNECNINNFDILDNLLWLWGKIEKGNYSLILNKNDYLELISKLKLNSKKSKDIDLEMKLKESDIVNIINNDDLKEFINIKNCWKK